MNLDRSREPVLTLDVRQPIGEVGVVEACVAADVRREVRCVLTCASQANRGGDWTMSIPGEQWLPSDVSTIRDAIEIAKTLGKIPVLIQFWKIGP